MGSPVRATTLARGEGREVGGNAARRRSWWRGGEATNPASSFMFHMTPPLSPASPFNKSSLASPPQSPPSNAPAAITSARDTSPLRHDSDEMDEVLDRVENGTGGGGMGPLPAGPDSLTKRGLSSLRAQMAFPPLIEGDGGDVTPALDVSHHRLRNGSDDFGAERSSESQSPSHNSSTANLLSRGRGGLGSGRGMADRTASSSFSAITSGAGGGGSGVGSSSGSGGGSGGGRGSGGSGGAGTGDGGGGQAVTAGTSSSSHVPWLRSGVVSAGVFNAGGYVTGAVSGSGRFRRRPARLFHSNTLEHLMQRVKVMGLVRERALRFKTLPDCVVAKELVDFLVTSRQCGTRGEAVELGKLLVDRGYLVPATGGDGAAAFIDDVALFKLGAPVRKTMTSAAAGGGVSGGAAIGASDSDPALPSAVDVGINGEPVARTLASAIVQESYFQTPRGRAGSGFSSLFGGGGGGHANAAVNGEDSAVESLSSASATPVMSSRGLVEGGRGSGATVVAASGAASEDGVRRSESYNPAISRTHSVGMEMTGVASEVVAPRAVSVDDVVASVDAGTVARPHRKWTHTAQI